MSASALPIFVNLGGPTAAAPATSAAAEPIASDFVTLVQQLLGQAPTSPEGSAAALFETLQAATGQDELEEGRTNECAGLAALLALLPRSGADAAAVDGAGDLIGELSSATSRGASAVDLASKGAAERLLSELEGGPTDVGESDRASFAPTTFEANTAQRTALAEAALSRPVQAPVGSAAWSDEIAARLTLMAEHGKQAASLRLSPEHLGPLEVRITVNDDRASVWFGAAHADTRAAIEQALPRLRELFEAQGLSLADAGVFREPPREQPRNHAPASIVGDDATAAEESVTIARVRLGLVDAYA